MSTQVDAGCADLGGHVGGEDLDDVLASCEQLQMAGVVAKRRTAITGRAAAPSIGAAGYPAWRAEHASERRIKQWRSGRRFRTCAPRQPGRAVTCSRSLGQEHGNDEQ